MEGILRRKVVDILTEHHKKLINDPDIAKKLTPAYEMGCKRVTPSNTYLQSFNRLNVTLVTEGIECFTPEGIQTKDGKVHEVDSIVYATGFSLFKSFKSFQIYGLNREGETKVSETNGDAVPNGLAHSQKSLAEEWDDAPNAYKGITCPGYPNFFFFLGPNTGLGHNSVVFMIECQVAYAIDAIRQMIEKDIKSVTVKRSVNDKYQAWTQACMKNKVFNSNNCRSWYRNDKGLNFSLWPSHLSRYWWLTRKFDLNNYDCTF